jgi:hypothetical protein
MRSFAMAAKRVFIGIALTLLFITNNREIRGDRVKREIVIGNTHYVISVPCRWKLKTSSDMDSMDIHMEVRPELIESCQSGTFSAYLLEKNNSDLNSWVEYRLTSTYPSDFGQYRIESVEKISAGPYQGKLIHLYDLEKAEGYGLLEGILFTESHLLLLSYMYVRSNCQKALQDMKHILTTFQDSPEAVKNAKLYYPEGRNLGLEDYGIYLTLPACWTVKEYKKGSDHILVNTTRNGTLKIINFERVHAGIKGLKKHLSKHTSCPLTDSDFKSISFGLSSDQAFLFHIEGLDNKPEKRGIIGLKGRGGYCLLLSSKDAEELDLLTKVAAKAILIDPKKAKSQRNSAMKSLSKSLEKADLEMLRKNLSTLTLFSENKSVVSEIGKGLFCKNEQISNACAKALAYMGSSRASRIIISALKNKRVCPSTQIACIKSLGMIGGAKEKEALLQLRNDLPDHCTREFLMTLNAVISNFHN